MQYVEGKLTATRGWFHPVDRLSSMVSEVDSERVHQMLLLDDGTITALHEFSGDRRLVEWAAEELPEVLDYQISPLEGPILVYAHIEATELLSCRLEEADVVESRFSFTDARKRIYELSIE